MSEARAILNRGLEILEREIERLHKSSNKEESAGLLTAERDDLCAYMTVLRHLVGKDLGGGEDMATLSEEELRALANEYVGNPTGTNSQSKRRNRKTKKDDKGG